VMYGFYRVSLRLMRFFINVPPHQIFTAGVGLGLVVAAAAVAAFTIWNRRVSLHADHVYAAAMRELRKVEYLDEALGGFWRPGEFRGYIVESYEDALKGSERRARSNFFELPSQRVQMIFPLRGLGSHATVSLEAYKRHGAFFFEMLAVDIHSSGEHMLLCGSIDRPLSPEVDGVLEALKVAGAKAGPASPNTDA